MEERNNTFEESSKKPNSILIVTIMTFAYSGLSLAASLINIFNSKEKLQDDIKNSLNGYNKIFGSNFIQFKIDFDIFFSILMKNIVFINLFSFVSFILAIAGAFYVINLRKIGFKIYLSSKVIGLLSILIFYPLNNFFTITTLVVTLIIYMINIILYKINLKHLKY